METPRRSSTPAGPSGCASSAPSSTSSRATVTSASDTAAAGELDVAHLGILGGSFDPPHLGHLELARHALRELSLDRLLLMPALRSPHKPAPERGGASFQADPRERLAMCRLLAGAEPRVLVSDLELAREGPSYTVDTLRALHEAHPHTALTFVLGADIARTLPAWREPRALLELAGLAIAVRSGTAAEEVRAAVGGVLAGVEALPPSAPPRARARGRAREGEGDAPAAGDAGHVREEGDDAAGIPGGRVRFLSMPALDVSSSLVRERIQTGEPVVELVGEPVAAYIDDRRLYRARAGVSA